MKLRHARILGAGLISTAILATACLAPDAVPGATGGTGGGGGMAVPLAWAHTYGVDAGADQRALSVFVSTDGDAIVAGDFEGSLTIGSLPVVPNTEGRDAFVFSLDPSGVPHWVAGFAGAGDQVARRAVGTSGEGVLVAGTFTTSLYYAGKEYGAEPSGTDGFLARLDANRKLLWVLRASGTGDQTIQSLAVTGADEAIIAGTFRGSLDLGGMVIEGNGAAQLFVARVDASGKPKWITSLHGDAPDLDPLPACLVALAPDGTLRVAGTFSGAVTFDEDLGAIGTRDMFLGELDALGKPVWGHVIGFAGADQRVASIAIGPAGETLLSADLRGKVTLDGTTIQADGNGPDAFLAVYDTNGNVTWAQRYGSPADDHAAGAVFDASMNIHFAGQFRGAIDFTGDPPLLNTEASAGTDDIFLTSLTAAHEPLYAAAFGGQDAQVATSIAVDSKGRTVLAGYFRKHVDFGSGPFDAKNGSDIFIAKFEK